MLEKNKIFEFDPVIYPNKLWVCITPLLEDLQKKFYAYTEDGYSADFPSDFLDKRDESATCTMVIDKKSKIIGVLCIIHRISQVSAGIAAHEASHVCDFFSEKLGLTGFTFNDGEARAYLIGWATNCIWNVRNGRCHASA